MSKMTGVREKKAAKRRKKFNEAEALRLAARMALENRTEFEGFCESQYPTQGRVLYNALLRAERRLP